MAYPDDPFSDIAPTGDGDPFADIGTAKPKSKLQGFLDKAKAEIEKRRPKTLKEALLKGIGNAGLGVPSTGDIPFLPNQTVAGVAKGVVDPLLGATQLASHATGIGSGSVDSAINATNDFYRGNFDKSTAGELAGNMATMLIPGGPATGLGGKALTVAKSALLPAAMTPEESIKNEEDYWGRKKTEAGIGLATGVALPGALAAYRGGSKLVNKLKGKLANAPSVQEMQSELAGSFGGKSAGQALQDAAESEYQKAWTGFKEKIAPVDAVADSVKVKYENTIRALDERIAKAQTVPGGGDEAKDILGYLQQLRSELQDAVGKAPTAKPTTVEETVDFLGSLLNKKSGPKMSDKLDAAMQIVKNLGDQQRTLVKKHGSTLSRETLGEIRDNLLRDIEGSTGSAGQQYGEAREYFAKNVVPLFDRSQGGDVLTKIRDAWNPDDILKSLLQGGLRDAKTNKVAKVAGGAAADPLIWQAIENANSGANGRPGGFVQSMTKAMPALEGIADGDVLAKLKNMVTAARTAQVLGNGADAAAIGTAAGLGSAVGLPMVGGAAAGMLGLGAKLTPALSGQGMMWKAVQNPRVREMLSKAWNLPINSPELDAKIAQYVSMQEGKAVGQ